MILLTALEDGVVDITIEGTITKQDMSDFLEALSEASEGMEQGHMLLTITDFHWPSLGAIGFEFSHLGAFFKAYKHFERMAVVCDKGWVRKVSEWEGHLVRWIKIRAFTTEEQDLAEHWLRHGDVEQAA